MSSVTNRSGRHREALPLLADSLTPDEGDSACVCSSQDGSVLSEDGAGWRGEEPVSTEEDLQFVLSEHVDHLSDKR